jgi:hypothetical protein
MDQEALIQAMMSKGHSRESALATITGRAASSAPNDLRNLYIEYLGGAPGGGGTTSGGGGDYMSSLINTLTSQLVPQALEFDQEAARAAAEQEWNPYYDEILNDYLSDLARISPIRQENIGGNFADRGLYQSGQRQEAQQFQLDTEQIEKQRRERDLAREREAAITGQVEQQREEKYYGY